MLLIQLLLHSINHHLHFNPAASHRLARRKQRPHGLICHHHSIHDAGLHTGARGRHESPGPGEAAIQAARTALPPPTPAPSLPAGRKTHTLQFTELRFFPVS